MSDDKCPFCLPYVEKVSFVESQNFRAIYNLAPVLPGHVLIIPKNHITGFMELEELQLLEMVSFSRQIIKVLSNEFKTDSFDWTIQDGKPAGQTVEHMHMHIIPRMEGDLPEPGDWYPAMIKKEKDIIDSASRPILDDKQIKVNVSKLRNYFRKI